MFKGSMVALVTPMQPNGSIDWQALSTLVDWHINSGTTALIIAGTTGESATLTHGEQAELLKAVVKQVNERLPVIAGTGTNATRSTIELTQQAERAGATACLVVTPYYNKPPQSGLYQHYKAVAECTKLPIILYNVPGRTACDLLPDTIEKLSTIKNIIGIKEATGKLERAKEIRAKCGNQFEIYSGDDATALSLMAEGAQGVISVTANVAPKEMSAMCEAALNGNLSKAEEINAKLMPLHSRLFVEANPIPVKWALHAMGKIPSGIRQPLLTLDKHHHEEVKEALRIAGIDVTNTEAIG